MDEVPCKETIILVQAIINGETELDISVLTSRIELGLEVKPGMKYHM